MCSKYKMLGEHNNKYKFAMRTVCGLMTSGNC